MSGAGQSDPSLRTPVLHIPLDFLAKVSVCGVDHSWGGQRMNADQGIGLTVTDCLRENDERLSKAAAIARAGLTCAEAGHEGEALRIILDLEQLTGEADRLFGAAALMGWMRRQRERAGFG